MRVMNLLRAGGYLKVALVGLEGNRRPVRRRGRTAPPRHPTAASQ